MIISFGIFEKSMIIVVGGGPAGSLSAINLGKKYDVLLVEEHQTPGFPLRCAGLISERCFKAYRRYCNVKKALENEIKGAFMFSPSGDFLEVRSNAYVLDRRLLDLMLFEKASEFAKTLVKVKVRFKGRDVVLGDKIFKPDYLIGADGVYSITAKSFGFNRPELFLTAQMEVKFEALDERFVEVYFGKLYSKGFFAYAIPIGDTAKIGVVSRDNPMKYLKNLIEKHPSVSKRVRGCTIELNFGAIPIGLIDFVRGNVALIGDSAGMVKPYTGGGLYYLLIASEKLSENFPNLNAYKSSYLKELGKEYKYGMKILRLYSVLSDDDYDLLIKNFRDFDYSGFDMDRPSTFLGALKRFPAKLLLKVLKALFLF